jgi:hypothetical protein
MEEKGSVGVVLVGEVVCRAGSPGSCRCGRGRRGKERELVVDMG